MTHPFSWKRIAAASLFLALALTGCRRKSAENAEQSAEEPPRMASTVHTGDSKAESQLVNGFYGIEQNAWRWTAQRFSVVLKPPAGAAQKGASLNVQLAVPDAILGKLKTVSLSATIGTTSLPPETYSNSGSYAYIRDVPASVLGGDTVRIDFQLDKALPPTGGDQRELGIIVNSVGLDGK
jgi:hypothetical protein